MEEYAKLVIVNDEADATEIDEKERENEKDFDEFIDSLVVGPLMVVDEGKGIGLFEFLESLGNELDESDESGSVTETDDGEIGFYAFLSSLH